jgi:DNA-binding NarL/FixJ family response regulator
MTSELARILLIDDNPKLLSDTLPLYGYDVTVATDGLVGLKILDEDFGYDLIILDVVMPNLDGWETLKAIRNNKNISKIPIVMLTSVDDMAKQVTGLKYGADDYIVKPFVLPNLLARIEALLRRSLWNKNTKTIKPLPFVKGEKISPLTQREKEILTLVSKGNSNSQIADKLFVREVTVKTHLNSIYRKLNVDNRVQAVLLAQQTEII